MMDKSCEVLICNEPLTLLSQKAIFWKKKELLIVSDLHLGKAGHFRKHGIPVSGKIHTHDLSILENLLKDHSPRQVLLLGDLFHSLRNNEWDDFLQFLAVFEETRFTLVRGNHDIMSEYPESLKMVDEEIIRPFSFTHQKQNSAYYNISGHVHPGYRVRGLAREGVTVPCFYFSKNHAIMPAFGQFTGIKKIRPIEGDKIFGIADEYVMELV